MDYRFNICEKDPSNCGLNKIISFTTEFRANINGSECQGSRLLYHLLFQDPQKIIFTSCFFFSFFFLTSYIFFKFYLFFLFFKF